MVGRCVRGAPLQAWLGVAGTPDPAVGADGCVRATGQQPGFVVVDADGLEFGPGTEWLLQLVANDCSRHTVRAYAMSLLRFLRFCWATECRWDQVSERVVRDFVVWARQADKFTGAKNLPGPRLAVNRVTGKKVQTARYAPATINHTGQRHSPRASRTRRRTRAARPPWRGPSRGR